MYSRYLHLLDLEREPPSFDALSTLVRAHLINCPFENISKLYRGRCLGIRAFPRLEELLDGIEHHHLGGTCYANNYYLCQLLRDLDYDAVFCGADMSAPDVHTVVMVSLGGRRYLVDVGYAAPFFAPLPLDSAAEIRIPWGEDEFVLRPQDEMGRSRLDHYRSGTMIHGYLAKPEPRNIEYFDRVIRESLEDSATFMNAVRLERFFPDHSVSIYNTSLWFSRPDGRRTEELEDRKQLVTAIEEHFEIPGEIVEAALAAVPDFRGIHD